MQFFINQTDAQKLFLSHCNNESMNFYKSKFAAVNFSGELDHSLTTTLFNLITRDSNALIDILPSFSDVVDKSEIDSIVLKKQALSGQVNENLAILSISFPLVGNFLLKKPSNEEYMFLSGKCSSLMNKLAISMTVYEELYIINTLALSYDNSFSLSFNEGIFTFGTRSKTVSFTILPIFFFVKYLVSNIHSENGKKFILEKLLEKKDFHSVSYLLTISDMDQISDFYNICNMKYLSNFFMTKLLNNELFQIPRVINLSQLHI